ncbi:MAG: amino acid adenylation domain-containing protein, partial [Methylococcales bacterium]|nr:amino acid adenylation domain-containing protein [Methylococcales bacterium]
SVLYEAFTEGLPSPLPELSIQYADFAFWQRQWLSDSVIEKQINYWRHQLDNTQILDLPFDSPRAPINSYNGKTLHFSIGAETTDQCHKMCQQQNITLYMFLLSVFQILLHRYCRQDDIAIGSPVAGRYNEEVEPLIGFFVNTLVCRSDLSADPTVSELLLQNKNVVLDAFAHQDIPFERLVEVLNPPRYLNITPYFQAMFSLQNTPKSSISSKGIRLQSVPLASSIAKFDLTLNVSEIDDQLQADFEYNADLFVEPTIERLSSHFNTLIKKILKEPGCRLSQIDLLSNQEKQLILHQWNKQDSLHDFKQNLHHLFEKQVLGSGDDIAVANDDLFLTYRELNEKANGLARYLLEKGVVNGDLIAICLQRSHNLVIALLAVLKTGAAYVPVDPDYPEDRIDLMLMDSQSKIIITETQTLALLPVKNIETICLDKDYQYYTHLDNSNLNITIDSKQLAYVIYTSGSTGKPKGVGIPHQAIVNHMLWMQDTFPLNSSDKVLQKTPFSFDASIWEFYAPLIAGAQLVIAKPRGHRDAEYLLNEIADKKVSILQTVPTLLRLMLSLPEAESKLFSIKRVFCGGETLSTELASQTTELGLQVINLYGPTECTIDATFAIYDETIESPNVTIGRPIANIRSYILDDFMNPVPVGVAGELYLAGVGVANGYLYRSKLNKEKFLQDPFIDNHSMMYKTGDLVKYHEDGNIEFLGRLDDQVKLRGFRIELGEISSCLNQHPQIKESVVIVREESADNQRLMAFYVLDDDELLDISDIRNWLKKSLPDYMIPVGYQKIVKLPLLPNGKIDLKALPETDVTLFAVADKKALPRNPIEEIILEIWSNVLKLDEVGLYDNFFDIGGHSLLATRVIAQINHQFKVELPIKVLFEHSDVPSLAEIVEAQRRLNVGIKNVSIVPVDRDKQLVLSYAQERLWFLDQLEPLNPIYNIPSAVRLTGELKVDLLKQAINCIIDRHEILKINFKTKKGKASIVKKVTEKFTITEANNSAKALDEAVDEAHRMALEFSLKAFDLSVDWLIRVHLIKLAKNDSVLLVNMHHSISDGWSVGIFIKEFSALYSAYVQGQDIELPELPVQYVDYSHWQRKWLKEVSLENQLNFWVKQLQSAEPFLKMPTDRPRPRIQTFRGRHDYFRLPAELVTDIKQLNKDQNVTLFMTLLTAWQILLSRYSGQEDVSVGVPIAGRSQLETQNLIGFFVNVLVMRCHVSKEQNFIQLLKRQKAKILDAYQHQDLPFEQLVEAISPERNTSFTPLIQIGFALQNIEMECHELPDLSMEPFNSDVTISKYDMTLFISEDEQGMSAIVEYNTDLFDGSSIELLMSHYQKLLENLVKQPQQTISAQAVMSSGELSRILDVSADTTEQILPLTASQRDLFIDTLMNPQTQYNSFAYVLDIAREINVSVWHKALLALHAEQPLLRAKMVSCSASYAESAYQIIEKKRPIKLDIQDLSQEPLDDTILQKEIQDCIHWQYNLPKDSLVYNSILKVSNQRFISVLTVHHMLMDGIGAAVYLNRLCEIYDLLMAGNKDIIPPKFIFNEYITWNNQVFDTENVKNAWQEKVKSIEPLDFTAVLPRTHQTLHKKLMVDEQLWRQIKKYCRRKATTAPIFFKAIYAYLLKLYCRPEQNFVLYEIVGGRARQHRKSIGCYYQQIPLIFDLSAMTSESEVNDYLNTIKSELRELADEQYISVFLQKQLIPQGKVSFFYNYYNFASSISVAGGLAPLDIHINFAENQVQFIAKNIDDQLQLNLHYNSDYFTDLDLLDRILVTAKSLVDGAKTLADINYLFDDELKKLTKTWNEPQHIEKKYCLHQVFEERSRRQPKSIAVSYEGRSWRYGEIDRKSSSLANHLINHGVGPDVLVGLCITRSVDLIIGLLGILKAGGAYLPLDPAYPVERLQFMLEDSQVSVIVTLESLMNQLPAHDAAIVCLDTDWDIIELNNSETVQSNITPDNLAYVIYTSGSTGKPKGVEVSHYNVMRLFEATRGWYDFNERDVWTMFHSYAF